MKEDDLRDDHPDDHPDAGCHLDLERASLATLARPEPSGLYSAPIFKIGAYSWGRSHAKRGDLSEAAKRPSGLSSRACLKQAHAAASTP